MEKIRFTSDQGSLFYSSLKDSVKSTFEKKGHDGSGGKKMIQKIIFFMILIPCNYYFMLKSDSYICFLLFYLAYGLSVLFCVFNVSHDAAHGVAVKGKRFNQILFKLTFTLLGNNAYVWGKNHISSHHLYTNIDGRDIDIHNNPLVRLDDQQPWKKIHRYQFLYVPILVLFYSLNWLLVRDFAILIKRTSRSFEIEVPVRERLKLVFGKLIYFILMLGIPCSVTNQSGFNVLTAFIALHFVSSVIFYFVLSVAHVNDRVAHPQQNQFSKEGMSWASLQLSTTLDFSANSRFFNFILGGFNTHAIHHLFPNVSHVHYREIFPQFEKIAADHGIEYHHLTYSAAIKSHFRYLYRLGKG